MQSPIDIETEETLLDAEYGRSPLEVNYHVQAVLVGGRDPSKGRNNLGASSPLEVNYHVQAVFDGVRDPSMGRDNLGA